MNLEQAFLDAIAANPSDLTPRLIFMDWLEERGDPRGELLRLLHTLTQEIHPLNRTALEARLRGLLESGVQPVGPFWTNGIGMKFAWIAPGRFLMGSPATELEREDDETQHEVMLTKGFYMGVHTVTQEQWLAVMGNNLSIFQQGGQNHPVTYVSWNDCQEFVKNLRKQDGKPYGLPTEAEWEYACRAGTTTPFHFGSVLNGIQANCDGDNPYNTQEKGPSLRCTTVVGSYAANAWGLHDMHGNVWQWCKDYYGPYERLEAKNPFQSTKHSQGRRVLRGGCCSYFARDSRAACRYVSPYDSYSDVGFRVSFRLD